MERPPCWHPIGVSEPDELRAALSASHEDRRRLERDLHDGVQQDLVAISVALQLARQLAESDRAAADVLLEETTARVQDALDRVRELAQAAYPASLGSHGLADALRWAGDGRVRTNGLGRYPLEVEEAVYFSCVALAQHGPVSVWEDDGVLHVQSDAGEILHVRDRLAAFGVVYDDASPR